MIPPTPKVYVVHNQAAFYPWVRSHLESIQLSVEAFATGEEFLKSPAPGLTGCLVLDVRLPDMDGLEVQEQLRRQRSLLALLIVSAHGDVATVVRAMRLGAIDFLEEPCSGQLLIERVRQGFRDSTRRWETRQWLNQVREREQRLTAREREVFAMMVNGMTTKELAASLGISAKTAEGHRAAVMRKMEATSLAELVRTALVGAAREEVQFHDVVPRRTSS